MKTSPHNLKSFRLIGPYDLQIAAQVMEHDEFDDYLLALGYDASLLMMEASATGYVEEPVTVAIMAGFDLGKVA